MVIPTPYESRAVSKDLLLHPFWYLHATLCATRYQSLLQPAYLRLRLLEQPFGSYGSCPTHMKSHTLPLATVH